MKNVRGIICNYVAKGSLKLRKRSPEILIVCGIVGSVAAIVSACKATTKIDGILEERQAQIDKVEEWKAKGDEELYSEEDAGRDKLIINLQTAGKIAKMYAPAIALEAVSIGALLTSHNIMARRNLALGASYAAIKKAFDEYRDRVTDKFGSEVDKQMRYGGHQEKIKTKITDEDGKDKIVSEGVTVIDDPKEDSCLRYFTKSNPYWDSDPEYVRLFLKNRQDDANDKLRNHGYLVINDVFQALGFTTTKAGMISGWIKNGKKGDGYVEFDVTKVKIPNEFGKLEDAFAIDFNIDGVIYNDLT